MIQPFCPKVTLKKTTDHPRNPHGEKVRRFATLIVSKTSQYENGTFRSRPFLPKTETAKTLNTDKATEQPKTPARRL